MGIIVRPEVSFFFSVMDAQENDRDQVKSDLKTKIKLIDPIPIDPAGTVRYKWDSLLPVHADPRRNPERYADAPEPGGRAAGE